MHFLVQLIGHNHHHDDAKVLYNLVQCLAFWAFLYGRPVDFGADGLWRTLLEHCQRKGAEQKGLGGQKGGLENPIDVGLEQIFSRNGRSISTRSFLLHY